VDDDGGNHPSGNLLRAVAPWERMRRTGVFQGLYTYPNGESASFVATLIDSSGALSGSTHEPCARAVSSSGTLYATLAGSRTGSAVAFHKIYDGKAPHYEVGCWSAGGADRACCRASWLGYSCRDQGLFVMFMLGLLNCTRDHR
jgi:hypothetical protein